MVKEYIEREAAIDAMTADNLLKHFDSVEDVIEKRFHRAAERILVKIPAADVVEVVRCCECIYHDDESQYHYCRKWRRNCPNDSDFFCKWGKRKDGGQDDAEIH